MTDTTPMLQPKPWISGIAPYVPGKSAGADGRPLIKLSANENPLGTGEKAREAFSASLADADALSRYPDPGSVALREAIAAKLRSRSGADHLRQRVGRTAPSRGGRLCRAGR